MKSDIEIKNERIGWIAYTGIIFLLLILYLLVNHLPLNRHTIPFLPEESSIPFLPWTFAVYISVFFQGILVLKDLPYKIFKRQVFVFSCMAFVAFAIFILLPIEYPRTFYPTTNSLIFFFRFIDGAGNCFPSLHVAITIFLAGSYCFMQRSFTKRFFMWIWTISITTSVLTTKQHYIVDVIGGIILVIPFLLYLKPHEIHSKRLLTLTKYWQN